MSITPAQAARITVWCILVVTAYALFVYGVCRLMAWLSAKYPRLTPTHDEYYGIEPYPELDDSQDYEEGTEPPRAA